MRVLCYYLLNLILLLLSISCKNPKYIQRKKIVIKGASIAHVHRIGKGYGSGVTRSLYSYLKKVGYDSVQLVTFAYQRDLAVPELTYNDPTLTNNHLEKEIQIAHDGKMKVMLKPHIWPGNNWSPAVFRDKIDFKVKEKLSRWFDNYFIFLKPQIQIAIKHKVEFIVIGTELTMLSWHTKYWVMLIQKIRKLGYKGGLTYAALAYNAKKIHFWQHLDYIGLDFYYGTGKKDSNQNQLQKVLIEKFKESYIFAAKKKKAIILTEIGYPANNNAFYKPYAWPEYSKDKNNEIQKLAYMALADTFEKVGYPYGIFIWKYATTLDSYEKFDNHNGFNPVGKPAEKVISRIFSRR